MIAASSDHAALIEKYAGGGRHLEQAIQHLSVDDLLAVPVPGKWSIQQVVIHLADAELANADRIKRVIATDNPVLLAWDQNRFLAELCYDAQSAEDAVAIVTLVRRQLSRMLVKLPPAAWARSGQHTERGPITLVQLVELGVKHLEHHLRFVAEKREAMGKLMW